MMDNYFGFFSQHPALVDFHKRLADDLRNSTVSDAATTANTSEDDKQFVIDSMSSEISEGVIVSISEDQSIGPERLFAPDIFDSMTFEPKKGVFVETDKPDLVDHLDIKKRISMVEGYTNYEGVSSDGMQKIAEAQRKSDFSLATVLSYAGAFEEGVIRSVVQGVVEVGDFTGNLNIDGLVSEDTTYSSGGKSVIGRRSDGSQMSLSLKTSTGTQIDVSISIKDEFNIQISEGARRSYEISFEASAELTEEEANTLQDVLGSLDPLINDFKNSKSLNPNHVVDFENVLNSISNNFTDVGADFSYSAYLGEKTMSLSMKDSKAHVGSAETDMNIYYQQEYHVMDDVESAFGYVGSKGQDYFLSFLDA